MKLNFTKMHGIGNDYIYVNCLNLELSNVGELSKKLSDRHFGIGSDGLVLIKKSKVADFFMSMFNSDGTEAEMCGNAIRCVAAYVYNNGLVDDKKEDKLSLSIETLSGIKYLKLYLNPSTNLVDKVTVNMKEPWLNPKDIPVSFSLDRVINEPINVDGTEYRITCVSMGNPHAIIYVDDVNSIDIQTIGPKIECFTKIFPRKTNVEFVNVKDRNNVSMRVWERGAGETLACGTGACATVVASVLNNLTDRNVRVHLLGGNLDITWNKDDNCVYMTGGATKVFDGCIEI